jgi:hypothetical protein
VKQSQYGLNKHIIKSTINKETTAFVIQSNYYVTLWFILHIYAKKYIEIENNLNLAYKNIIEEALE